MSNPPDEPKQYKEKTSAEVYVPSRRQSAEGISDQDRLNRSRLVEALATVLSGDNDHHQTIGLLGDWGVGKSTTVHLLKQALWQRREQQPFLFGTFNAWEYEHTDNLQAGMAQEMLKALSRGNRVSGGLGMLFWWLAARIPFVRIPLRHKRLRLLCKMRLNPRFGSKKRMLFLVDDLNGCSRETIVKVFEAVHLVLGIPQVTVIIAVDQRIALAALALHYQELAQHHELSNPQAIQAIARDYLAKVIHIPITLTPADPQSINGYLESIWQETADNVDKGGASAQPSEPKAASPDVKTGLSERQKHIFKRWVQHFGFSNPRQLKRLHNSYNLLRHYYGEEGQFSGGESSLLDGFTSDLGSPMLITLFALEYIHSLEDAPLRSRLLHLVQQPRERSFQEEGDGAAAYQDPNRRITDDVLQVITGKLSGDTSLIQAVQPFVLPSIVQAVEPEDAAPETDSG